MAAHRKYTDEIFAIDAFCQKQECEELIAFSESIGYEAAMINTERGPRKVSEVRNNSRVILDEPNWAVRYWDRIREKMTYTMKGWKAVGLNERFRFYRYDVGQKFHWHADGSVKLEDGRKSFLTFLIYLNDGFEGGETCFRGGLKVEPHAGRALLFTHWQKHMGNEVTAGRKYVLRSDVMFRRGT